MSRLHNLVALGLCLLWPVLAQAQAVCTNGNTTVGTATTITPAGSNRWGFVWLTSDTAVVQTCTVTWGIASTTAITGAITAGTGQFGVWFKTDAEPAAALTTVTASGGGCSINIIQVVACTGVDQSTPNESAPTPVEESGTGVTATTVAITTVTGDVILAGVSINGKDTAGVAPTTGTQVVEENTAGPGHYSGIAYLNGDGTSQSVVWGWTGNARHASIGFNVNQAGGAAAPCRRGLLGVGCDAR